MKKADAFVVFLLYFLLLFAFTLITFMIFAPWRANELALQDDLAPLDDDEMFWASLSVDELLLTCAVTLLAGALPFLYAALRRIPFRTFFRLKCPSPALFAKSLLLMLAAWILAAAVRVAVYALSGKLVSEADVEILTLSAYPQPLVFLAIAILPAVCEEILYRGFILSALRKSPESPRSGLRDEPFAILLCSLLFAAAHMDLLNFLSIFILGLAFSYAACATGSLAIPMALHFFNNSAVLVLHWLFPDFKALS